MTLQHRIEVQAPDNYTGYRKFSAGSFDFRRDEYFAHIDWPKGRHIMPIDAFLRALRKNAAQEQGAACSGGITVTGTTPHNLG